MATNVMYVRWQKDEPRESRVWAPLEIGHPAFDAECFLCGEDLGGTGKRVQSVVLGPEDEHTRLRHREGRWYAAAAILLHAECVQGAEPSDG